MATVNRDVDAVLRAFRFKGDNGLSKLLNQITELGRPKDKYTEEELKIEEENWLLAKNELLIAGAKNNNMYQIIRAIKEGADVNHICGECHQTALIIATSKGHFRIVHFLLQHGADPWIEDHVWRNTWYFAFFGSTLSSKESNAAMIQQLLDETPNEVPKARVILMACYAANTPDVTEAVLDRIKITTESQDSNLYCRYHILGLESFDDPTVQIVWPDGSKTPLGETPLHVLTKKRKAELLVHPVCLATLKWKWEKFGRFIFLVELVLFLAFLAALSAVCILSHPDFLIDSRLDTYDTDTGATRLLLEVFILVVNAFLMFIIILDAGFIPKSMLRVVFCLGDRFITSLPKNKVNLLPIIPHLLLLLLLFLRSCSVATHIQVGLLSICAVLSWMRLIHYLQLLEKTGPFFIMLTEMLFQDVLPFTVVLCVVVPGFALGLSLLISHNYQSDMASLENFSYFDMTMVNLLQTMAGSSTFSTLLSEWAVNSMVNTIVVIMYLVFLLMVPILALNLLIAMMSNTYSKINDNSIAEWGLRRSTFLMLREPLFTNSHFGYVTTQVRRMSRGARLSSAGNKVSSVIKESSADKYTSAPHLGGESPYFKKNKELCKSGCVIYGYAHEMMLPYENIRASNPKYQNFQKELLILSCCKLQELQAGLRLIARNTSSSKRNSKAVETQNRFLMKRAAKLAEANGTKLLDDFIDGEYETNEDDIEKELEKINELEEIGEETLF